MAEKIDGSDAFHIDGGVAKLMDKRPVRLIIPKFNDGKLMITKISGGVTPNFQLMYSLGADVFINAFNQRLSVWKLEGYHIPAACPLGAPQFNGEPAFVDLYRRYNIRNADAPLDLAFSGIVLVGFFVELTINEYTQSGVEAFRWETPFLGRMTNLLENPDPILVEDAVPDGPAVDVPIPQGELDDIRESPEILLANGKPASLGPPDDSGESDHMVEWRAQQARAQLEATEAANDETSIITGASQNFPDVSETARIAQLNPQVTSIHRQYPN